MATPVEIFKLPRGMGRLVRYIQNGLWSWQRWNKVRNKWTSTPTEKINRSEAEQFVYQQSTIQDINKFRYQGVKILFTTVADEYLKTREVGRGYKRLRPSSLQKVRTSINAFREFIGTGYEALCIDQIDSVMLNQFLESEAGRISAGAANRNLNFIGKILEFSFKKNYILHNPAPKVERAVENLEDQDDDQGFLGWPCPTPEEVRRIIESAKPQKVATGEMANNGSEKGRQVFQGINANDYTDLFATLCLTGLRIGEAIHLTWADVDPMNKVILIRAGKKNGKYWQPKTKQSIRRIPIVPELEDILKMLKKTNRKREWVFETKRGTQFHPSNADKRLREICEQVGIKKRIVPHSFRKYWASTVAQQGLPWQIMIKCFGHSDFELILSTYYAQNDDSRLVAEASKIDFGLGLTKTA